MRLRDLVGIKYQHAMILRKRADPVRIGYIEAVIDGVVGESTGAAKDDVARIRVSCCEHGLAHDSSRRLTADKILRLERCRKKRANYYGCKFSQREASKRPNITAG